MYKVVIQKIVVNVHKPKESDYLRNRRVVLVDDSVALEGREELRRALDAAGMLNDTTGEIVSVEKTDDIVLVGA